MVELRDTVAGRNLRDTLGCIASEAIGGDNLGILLATYFEPSIEDDELDDSGTWKQGAIEKANAVLDAIHEHYTRATDTRIAELEARAEKAEADVKRVTEDRKYIIGFNDGFECAKKQLAEYKIVVTLEAELARIRAAGTFNEGIINELIDFVQESRDEFFDSATVLGDPATLDDMTRAALVPIDDLLQRARSLRRPDDGGA